MKKALYIGAIATTIVGIGAIGANKVWAQDNTELPYPITKIVEKFDLDPQKVREVLDEAHKDKFLERRQILESDLSKAVEQGEITEAQKTAILIHHDKMKMDGPKIVGNQTDWETHKKEMGQKRQEFESWMKENGLTAETLDKIGLFHGGKGFGRGHMRTFMKM